MLPFNSTRVKEAQAATAVLAPGEYLVEAILGHRFDKARNCLMFQVKWLDWEDEKGEPWWEPWSNLVRAPAFKEYVAQHKITHARAYPKKSK